MTFSASNTLLLGVDNEHPDIELLIRFSPFAFENPPVIIKKDGKRMVCFESVQEARNAVENIGNGLSFGPVSIFIFLFSFHHYNT